MKYSIVLLIFVVACKQFTENENLKDIQENVTQKVDFNVALKFINGYNQEFINHNSGTIEWLSKNKFVTKNLIERYKRMQDSAWIADPELGLGFDPIVNGQDSDDQGFEIKEIDSTNGFVTVKGKSVPEYQIILKVIRKNGVDLVDGSGIINIPESKYKKH
jgi:hypothetical protein